MSFADNFQPIKNPENIEENLKENGMLNQEKGAVRGMVTDEISCIPVANFGESPVEVIAGQFLGRLTVGNIRTNDYRP